MNQKNEGPIESCANESNTIDSDELREFLASAYDRFPGVFQQVDCSESAIDEFPELQVIADRRELDGSGNDDAVNDGVYDCKGNDLDCDVGRPGDGAADDS